MVCDVFYLFFPYPIRKMSRNLMNCDRPKFPMYEFSVPTHVLKSAIIVPYMPISISANKISREQYRIETYNFQKGQGCGM